MTQIVMPSHMNYRGSLFGGIVVQWVDVCAAVSAMRHAGGGNTVTASIDRLDFLSPIHQGDIVILRSQVNFAGRTSMEIGCRVESEDPNTGERSYCTKAYLTFVALDDDGKPRPIPRLQPESESEQRRFRQAQERKAQREATRLSLAPGAP
jgi:acyl-CoA hydrolase